MSGQAPASQGGHTPAQVGHTSGPWIQVPHPYPDCAAVGIGTEGDDFAAAHTTCYLNAAANAALIVRAVNSHAALCEALASIRVFAQDCIENGHDRGQLGNLYAIRDLCDRAALASPVQS